MVNAVIGKEIGSDVPIPREDDKLVGRLDLVDIVTILGLGLMEGGGIVDDPASGGFVGFGRVKAHVDLDVGMIHEEYS